MIKVTYVVLCGIMIYSNESPIRTAVIIYKSDISISSIKTCPSSEVVSYNSDLLVSTAIDSVLGVIEDYNLASSVCLKYT